MPAKNSAGSTKIPGFKQISGPGAVIVLVLVGVFLVFQAWQDNHPGAAPLPLPATALSTSPTLPAALTLPRPPTTSPQGQTAATATQNTAPIEVYFSDPLSGAKSGGPETHLVDALNRARKTIDMAIYNLSLDNVASALIAAQQRGVAVRLVMESEAMGNKQPQRLANAGIAIVGDQREGLMHNKFTVIDAKEVWTGSMNYTNTSAYADFNNLVRLPSVQAAQDYTIEFNEMYTENLFGPDTRAATPYHQLTIAGITVEIYFSPDDGVAEHIVTQINAAQKSIDFLAYSFTSNDIALAVLDRSGAGVTVRGVFDQSQVESNEGGEYTRLKRQKLAVLQDGIPGLLHDKVFILDGKTVITGSYNFSANAEKVNDENLVIIHDRRIAGLFLKNFATIYENGK
jgi:phosphatidylserine/phosphatidylglycerophosphate/cardiolipin synthase-like enzyme